MVTNYGEGAGGGGATKPEGGGGMWTFAPAKSVWGGGGIKKF